MFLESRGEAYLDGGRLPGAMLASRVEVGRDAHGCLAVETTLHRSLQAGEPWLCTATFRPHALRDTNFHTMSAQCVSHPILSMATQRGRPIWYPAVLECVFAEAYGFLFAAKDLNPHAFEHDAGPKEELSLHEHGTTVDMIDYTCRERSVPLHTCWRHCLSLTFRPHVYDNATDLLLCAKGKHACFYGEAQALACIAKMQQRHRRTATRQ